MSLSNNRFFTQKLNGKLVCSIDLEEIVQIIKTDYSDKSTITIIYKNNSNKEELSSKNGNRKVCESLMDAYSKYRGF